MKFWFETELEWELIQKDKLPTMNKTPRPSMRIMIGLELFLEDVEVEIGN
jgi:hypothetical protein